MSKYPRQKETFSACIVCLMGLPMILITLVPNIYCFYLFSLIYGLGGGGVSVACNIDCLEIWRGREDGRPAMYAAHFCFALGTMIGPLLAAQALLLDKGIYILYVGVGSVAMMTSMGYLSLAIKANLQSCEYEKLDEQNNNGNLYVKAVIHNF